MGIEKIKHLPGDLPGVPWLWHTGATALASWAQGVRLLVHDWLQSQGVAVRDAVVVVPQMPHVFLAKQAWAREVGGWMPRFETASSLLQRLPTPALNVDSTGLVLDETLDLLWIHQQLRQSVLGRQWLRDAPSHAQLASTRAMALAHEWLKICLGLAPARRAAWVDQTLAWCAQQRVQQPGRAWQPTDLNDVGARERWLTGLALDWAMQSWPALAHRNQPLFECDASAWVLVTVGTAVVPGSDAFVMQQVMQEAKNRHVPVRWMPACWAGEWADDAAVHAGQQQVATSLPTLTAAQHFNDEAQAAAAWVIAAVQQRRMDGVRDPVVLVTQDRVLSRRIRALLMPHEGKAGLVIQDESGWTLSTTRAAAAVTRLLAAAQPTADTWSVLDWLTHGWAQLPFEQGALQALKATEVSWRQHQVIHPWLHDDDDEAVISAWSWARQLLTPLTNLASSSVTLAEALGRLKLALQSAGVWQALLQDEAGQLVLSSLRLADAPADEGAGAGQFSARQWELLSRQHTVNLSALTDWVQQCLGRVNFEPQVRSTEGDDIGHAHGVDVVMTPMGRAVLRPFACVVMPGVDESQLGVMPPAGHLLGSSEAALGLSDQQLRGQSQWAAFALLAAQPQVKAVYRQSQEGGPVAPSAWLGRWWALAQTATWHEHHWPLVPDPRAEQVLDTQPLVPVMPRLDSGEHEPDLLFSDRLSPTAYQRLRDCPYRYFALDLLRLREPDEHDEGMAQQDYGNWLHEVLRRFHLHELEGHRHWPPEEDLPHWLKLADEVAHEQGLHATRKAAHLALYQSSLASLAEKYVAWHHQQLQDGWHVSQLEQQVSVRWAQSEGADNGAPEAWQLTLYGNLDRVDTNGSGAPVRVIDYKTGSWNALSDRVKKPLEDTQLAFYALLLIMQAQASRSDVLGREAPEDAIEAMYLNLNHEKVQAAKHLQVVSSAAQLAQGIRSDMARIREGHPMPALGEGALCERCEVRGLCRKDHQASEARELT